MIPMMFFGIVRGVISAVLALPYGFLAAFLAYVIGGSLCASSPPCCRCAPSTGERRERTSPRSRPLRWARALSPVRTACPETDRRDAGADQQAAARLVDEPDRTRIAHHAPRPGRDEGVDEGIRERQHQERDGED